MTYLRSTRLMRNTSMFLIVALVLTLVPMTWKSASAQVDWVKQVLLFPAADYTGAGMADLSRLATDKLEIAVNELPDVECTEFHSTSPIVRRAVAEGRLLPVYTAAGPVDAALALRIGYALGMDAVIVAGVDRLQIQQQPRQVEVTIRGQYFLVAPNYDVVADRPVANPQVQHSFSIGGVSKLRANYEGGDRPLIREALEDAAYKFKEIIAGRPVAEIPAGQAKPAPKKNFWKWLGPVLGVGLLIMLVSNKGGGEGRAITEGAEPPDPRPLQIESNAIRLLWNPPPATELILLRYQIQRSVNSGSWQYIDGGNAGPTRTSWPDFDVVDGSNYQYRIRAVYTNQAVSVWVYFNRVTFTQ